MPVAVVAGATGLVGRRIVERLNALGGWRVVGLCRRPPARCDFEPLAVDLASEGDCRARLAGLRDATHLFYAARFDHPEGVPESVDTNAAMFARVAGALDAAAPGLEHVNVVHGTKHYGHHLGPVPVPVTEASPRAAVPNFYHAHEDWLAAHQPGRRWTWSIARPHSFLDDRLDVPRSFAILLALYVVVQRELGRPFDFPGTARTFGVATQFTDTRLLAKACVWMATEPRCANQAFNVTNGDAPVWSDLWPRVAGCFGLAAGVPRGARLSAYMADKGPDWTRIVRRDRLLVTRLDEVALWPYADYVLGPEWDIISSMDKARRFGFTESVDTGALLARMFEGYRAARLIPQEALP